MESGASDDFDFIGVSVYYLETIFLREVQEAGYSRDSTIYQLEDLKCAAPGVIRQNGLSRTCPLDQKKGAAYIHCLRGDDHVGQATHMLSYTWGYKIGDIIDTLTAFCKKQNLNPQRTYFWICFLCVNQHRVVDCSSGNSITESFLATLEDRVSQIGSVVCMMAPWENPLYLSRVWCLYEMATAFANPSCQVHIAMPPREEERIAKVLITERTINDNPLEPLYKALDNTRVQEAHASQEADRLNILNIVRTQQGGYDHMNGRVIERLRTWVLGVLDQVLEEQQPGGQATKDCSDETEFVDCRVNLCAIDCQAPAIMVTEDTEEFDFWNSSLKYPVLFDDDRHTDSEKVAILRAGVDPRRGNIPLTNSQISELENQGCLVSGDITTAYLHLVAASFEKHTSTSKSPRFIFRPTSDFVWTSMKRSRKEMGNSWKKGWMALQKQRGTRKLPYNIHDDTTAITGLQLFEGNGDGGHFACVLIDRRAQSDGVFTFFDSGKRYNWTSMDRIREFFDEIGVSNRNSIWIDADVPQQAHKTHDCGVWMCMFMATFLRSLKQSNHHLKGVYRNVKIQVTSSVLESHERLWYKVEGTLNEKLVGWFGRAHVRETLFKEEYREDSTVLSMLQCEIA